MSLFASALAPCQRLVLHDVEEHVGLRVEGEEVVGLQDGLQVVPPCNHKGPKGQVARRASSSRCVLILDQVVVLWRQPEALPVAPL